MKVDPDALYEEAIDFGKGDVGAGAILMLVNELRKINSKCIRK